MNRFSNEQRKQLWEATKVAYSEEEGMRAIKRRIRGELVAKDWAISLIFLALQFIIPIIYRWIRDKLQSAPLGMPPDFANQSFTADDIEIAEALMDD